MSCQLSVVSCQLSVVSCQLSVVSCQLPGSRLGTREGEAPAEPLHPLHGRTLALSQVSNCFAAK